MHFRITFLFIILFVSGRCWADCLQTAGDFAVRICGEIQSTGSGTLVEGNGELKASVSGVLRKALGDAGASFSGKAVSDAYENVLRQDLGKELFNVRECRQKMVQVGIEQACKGPSQPQSNKQGLIDGTTIDLLIGKSDFERQLSTLGKTCTWGVDDQGSAVCSTTINWMTIPAKLTANFQSNQLSTMVISSYFFWKTQSNGPKYEQHELERGDKTAVDRFCTPQVRQKILSAYVGNYGTTISSPEKIEESLTPSLLTKWCEGRALRFCTADGNSSRESYVFRASQNSVLQVRMEKEYGSRNSEGDTTTEEVQWQSCRFTTTFLTG